MLLALLSGSKNMSSCYGEPVGCSNEHAWHNREKPTLRSRPGDAVELCTKALQCAKQLQLMDLS
jgi:hypothetical protein